MKKNTVSLASLIGFLLLASACATEPDQGQNGTMKLEQAVSIAGQSSCADTGTIGSGGAYDAVTKTWQIDFTPDPAEALPGCDPVCVVAAETQTAEIDWRCSTTVQPASKDDLIVVNSPLPNALVTSPLTIQGKARGPWYFEAQFSVSLFDANSTLLGSGIATAQGGWMTEQYVPFTATITFSTPTTATGSLVLEKANPSGEPQNANQLVVPVTFSQTAPVGQTVQLYYYDPEQDTDENDVLLCSKQGVVPVTREVSVEADIIATTIRELLKGNLSPAEEERGITTEFPLEGFALSNTSLDNGMLTLTFTDPLGKTIGGSCRTGILWAQIEATAMQFPEVQSVQFEPEELFQP